MVATKRVKKLNCLHARVDVVYTKVFEIGQKYFGSDVTVESGVCLVLSGRLTSSVQA